MYFQCLKLVLLSQLNQSTQFTNKILWTWWNKSEEIKGVSVGISPILALDVGYLELILKLKKDKNN